MSEETKPASKPTKVIIFAFTDGQWGAKVKVSDPMNFITERDFNKLTNLLTSQRIVIRRQAAMAYREVQRKANAEAKAKLTPVPVTVD